MVCEVIVVLICAYAGVNFLHFFFGGKDGSELLLFVSDLHNGSP
jgi:hypothetical protein